MLSDTNPEAEKVQIELLRKATNAQRLGVPYGVGGSLASSLYGVARTTMN